MVCRYIPATLGALACGVALQVNAASETFMTPTGSSTGGQPVAASAVFTTGMGTVNITLDNLFANPTSVVQTISDLNFTLSNGATSGMLGTSSGELITVNGDGTFSGGGPVSPTRWMLNNGVSGGLQLTTLGAGMPKQNIIGPPGPAIPPYSNANGSIAGNTSHNPFLNQTASFTVDISSVSPTTTITGATFSFGTTAGANLVPGTPVPEPASLGLLAMGLAGLGLFRRSSRKAKKV